MTRVEGKYNVDLQLPPGKIRYLNDSEVNIPRQCVPVTAPGGPAGWARAWRALRLRRAPVSADSRRRRTAEATK